MSILSNLASHDDPRIIELHQRVWIGYPKAIEGRQAMEALLKYPRTHRMPNLVIAGETNSGKTMLLENFFKKHCPPLDPNVEDIELPVFMMQAPPVPDEHRLYNAMLEKLFSKGPMREPIDAKLQRLKLILTRLNTRLIILDEFQTVTSGSNTKQRGYFNALKYLCNELRIPLVVAGTLEVLSALSADSQIANRFEPFILPKWQLDTDFLRLLATIETKLKLKNPSNLANREMAMRILDASEGTLGEIIGLVRLLASSAIISGKERINLDDLRPQNLAEIGWVPPSQRTKRGTTPREFGANST